MIKEELKIIPMTYDFVFKSVLQDKDSEDYLADILSNIIKIDKKYIKGNIVFKNTELTKEEKVEKGKTTDLIIELKENIINLEMNKSYYDGLYDKNDRYVDKIKDGIITKGEMYKKRKQLFQINFDNFEKFDERIIIKFEMMEKERGLVRSDYVYTLDPKIYHINLKRIQQMYYNKEKLNKFEKELLLMTIDSEKELIDITEGCMEMKKVVNKISKISKDEELRGIYDKEEQEIYIRNLIRTNAGRKGFEQGLEQGLEQGIEQGIEQGKNQTLILNIKKMYEEKIDINLISKITGVSIENIMEIVK